MEPRVVEMNDPSLLPSLGELWDRLHRQTPGATFFQTWEWLATTWRHFGRPQKLRLMMIYEGDEPVGIVPFCVREETYRVGKLRVLSYPLDDWGPFYGPLGADPVRYQELALDHVMQTERDWDMIDLRTIREQDPNFAQIDAAIRQRDATAFIRPRMEVPVIQLEGTWDDYLASQSRNWRRNMKREKQRVEEVGTLEFVRYRHVAGETFSTDHCRGMFDECQQVAERSWQADSSLGAAFCSPRVKPVLRDLHMTAARKGMLDVNLLRLDGEPVAFLYNYVCQGQVYALRSGYDANCPAQSLGTVLLAEVIRDSYLRGDRLINLGPGTQDYKLRFAGEIHRAICYTLYSRQSVRSQLLRARYAIDQRLPGFEGRCRNRLIK
ncbi:MAG: GNAT family N-acetyltransferase [Pirellulaceae bacterium]